MICNCPVSIDVHIAHCFDCGSLLLCGEPQFTDIFQLTQSRRMPPASTSPTTCKSWVVAAANVIRGTVAAMIPTRTAFVRCCSGNPAAGKPMTMALSPARRGRS